ncbi:MAG: hypothetical protein PHR10_06475 [Sphaerochaetaceae bacterium]|nr:hypothetical protein [Sphaerochaetaceae bacterium]
MAIDIARRSEGPKEFKNGYGQVEWLPGMMPIVKSYKCILQAGHTVTPERYEDKIVIFMFSHGTGYITGPKKSWNIDEISFFIPDFDNEAYTIYAATDLEYMMVLVDMLESDKAAYENTHIVLPKFKRLSEAEEYDQDCKGPNTRSWSIVHSGTLARVLFGVVKAEGEGTIEKRHPKVHQRNYALPGSDFTLSIEDESFEHYEGDWSFVPAGPDHSLVAKPGKTVFYVWFEIMVNEIKRD